MFSGKKGATRLALIVVLGMVVLKIAVYAITDSISILAQTTDSLLDTLSVFIAIFAINVSAKPADEDHHFGHGKVENISAAIQAVLIFTAGGMIIYSSITRIISEEAIEMTEAGIAVMAISALASFLLSRHLLKVAKTEDSLTLEGIGKNIAADVYSTAGVLAGLVIIHFTGLSIVDPIIALAMALIILKSGYTVIRKSIKGLMDHSLPKEEEDEIKAILRKHTKQGVSFDSLRTRKAGNQRFINLHMVVPGNTIVEESHRMCDDLEKDLKDRLPNTNVIIHVEPCDGQRGNCDAE